MDVLPEDAVAAVRSDLVPMQIFSALVCFGGFAAIYKADCLSNFFAANVFVNTGPL